MSGRAMFSPIAMTLLRNAYDVLYHLSEMMDYCQVRLLEDQHSSVQLERFKSGVVPMRTLVSVCVYGADSHDDKTYTVLERLIDGFPQFAESYKEHYSRLEQASDVVDADFTEEDRLEGLDRVRRHFSELSSMMERVTSNHVLLQEHFDIFMTLARAVSTDHVRRTGKHRSSEEKPDYSPLHELVKEYFRTCNPEVIDRYLSLADEFSSQYLQEERTESFAQNGRHTRKPQRDLDAGLADLGAKLEIVSLLAVME
jgi:hypothetical protein